MTRKELIGKCLFYKGEEVCPFQDASMRLYWTCERRYVEWGGEPDKKGLLEHYGGKAYKNVPKGILDHLFSWFEAHGDYDTREAYLKYFYEWVDRYIQYSEPRSLALERDIVASLKKANLL